MNDFGSTLRRLRQKRGLSLTQLSHLTNYSKGYLSKPELGERTAATATARVCDSVLQAKGRLLATLRTMRHHMSPELVVPMALTNVGTANEMLRSARPGSVTKLFGMLASIKEYAGWMAQERGRNELCKRLTQEAAQLALEAYASNGDRGEACETVRSVLQDIHRVDSDTIRVDLKALAEVLRRRWSRDAVVEDVLAELKPQLDGSAGLG